MTNLEKLKESLNLKVLNSNETINLKGGGKNKNIIVTLDPPPTKPIGGGGNPPTLETSTILTF